MTSRSDRRRPRTPPPCWAQLLPPTSRPFGGSRRARRTPRGIGFTWECDVHILFKRSMHNQALLGDGVHHRKRLAEALIGPIA